jgi:hypothetical protein
LTCGDAAGGVLMGGCCWWGEPGCAAERKTPRARLPKPACLE